MLTDDMETSSELFETESRILIDNFEMFEIFDDYEQTEDSLVQHVVSSQVDENASLLNEVEGGLEDADDVIALDMPQDLLDPTNTTQSNGIITDVHDDKTSLENF